MTTQITTYTPGRIASTDRGIRHLPALFNDNWLHAFFTNVDKAFEIPNAVYPYNVIQVKNSAQEIVKYEVEVALAGVGKENIDVKVRDGQLHINVGENTKVSEETRTFLKKGISQRRGSITFNLDEKVNAKQITSNYKDGLLCVSIPVVQPETFDVDIEVK